MDIRARVITLYPVSPRSASVIFASVAAEARWRPAARVARWALIAVTSLGILAAAFGVLMPAGLVVAGVGAVLLILLVAAEFEFDLG